MCVMIKRREFWIYQLIKNGVAATVAHRTERSAEETMADPSYQDPSAEIIYVREVVPIDWGKVWDKLGEWLDSPTTTKEVLTYREKLKELVEKSLKGEL